MFIVHVFTTMQTAAIVRAVFIKTTKKTTMAQEYRHFIEELKHVAWQNKLAVKNPHDISSDYDEREN